MSVKGLEESERIAAKITADLLRSLRKQKAEISDQLAKTKYLLADEEALKGWRTAMAAEDRRTALLSMMTDVERLYLEAGDSEAAKLFKKRMQRELMQKMTNLKANELEVKIRAEKLKAETRSNVLAGLNAVKQDSALREVYAQSRSAGGCLSGMFGRPFMRDLVTLETKAAGSKTLGQYMQNLYSTYEAGLKDVFVKGVVRGDSFQTMEQNLMKTTGVTAGKAKLLVRTESNAIMNDTVKQVIDSNPLVKGYRFRAVLDKRTSKICQEHDGEYIPKEEAKPGVNYPPLHPNCRSTVTTVLFNEDERKDKTQRYTKNGSNQWVPVPPGMKYPEFKQMFLSMQAGLGEQMPKGQPVVEGTTIRVHAGKLPPYRRDFKDFSMWMKAKTEESNLVYMNDSDEHALWESYYYYDDKEKDNVKRIESTVKQLKDKFGLPGGYSDVVIGQPSAVKEYLSQKQQERFDTEGALGEQWFVPADKRIVISFEPRGYIETIEQALGERSKAIEAGNSMFNVLGNSPEGIAIHEWGHVMSEEMTNAFTAGNKAAEEYWSWYKSLGKDEIRDGLSAYASQNRDEFEAECFSELMTSNPRPIALKFAEYMKQATNGRVDIIKTTAANKLA